MVCNKLHWYLEAVALERQSDMEDSLTRQQWERRLSALEVSLPFYRLEDTHEKSGMPLRLAELRNTISQIVYRRDLPPAPVARALAAPLEQFMSESPEFPPLSEASLFVDVTSAVAASHVTGIQRVVRELARRAGRHGGIPVFLGEDGAVGYDKRHDQLRPVVFKPSDCLVMPDLPLDSVPSAVSTMRSVRRSGGSNVVVIHDLFPLLFPQTTAAGMPDKFKTWFERCALEADLLMGVSRNVAQLGAYLSRNRAPGLSRPRIDWAHHGCDFKVTNARPSALVEGIISETTPYFLSVSTVEPRKAYRVTLDAMEKLWESGAQARYVIVGRYGWGQGYLKQRIVTHREFGRRLFWCDHLDDTDLAHLYRHARALVFGSIAEGFGLPLLEAALFGLPAIVSDIPVFREIAGDGAAYFPVADSEGLSDNLAAALKTPKVAPAIPVMSWDEAADRFFRKVRLNTRTEECAPQACRVAV